MRDLEDKTVVLTLAECETIEEATALLRKRLCTAQTASLTLAAESEVPEADVDRYASGCPLLKASAKLSAGQRLRLMARLLVHVSFGNTTLGASNVHVAIEGSDEATTSDSAGLCELILPAGHHKIKVDHGMSNEGSDFVEVDVSEVDVKMEISAPACLFVYLQAPDSQKGDSAPTNVSKLVLATVFLEGGFEFLKPTTEIPRFGLERGRGLALCSSGTASVNRLASGGQSTAG